MSSQRAQLVAELTAVIRQVVASSVLTNQKRADALGFNATDLQLLNMLELSGPTTPKILAQVTGLSTGGVTVALDRLEKARYVKREPNPDDRRSVLVHFLPKSGHPIFAQYKDVEESSRRVFAGFSDKEIALLTKLLRTLLAAS
jgi:DNA-binding MarR family transcriptional regulator